MEINEIQEPTETFEAALARVLADVDSSVYKNYFYDASTLSSYSQRVDEIREKMATDSKFIEYINNLSTTIKAVMDLDIAEKQHRIKYNLTPVITPKWKVMVNSVRLNSIGTIIKKVLETDDKN